MNQRELRDALIDLARLYFPEPTVIEWGKTKQVNPDSPFLMLTAVSATRHYLPIELVRNGVITQSYEVTAMVQVDLFTKGAELTDGEYVIGANENTAVSDLSDFLNFLNSQFVQDWCHAHNIAIHCDDVNDLTALVNSTSWDYRAMTELEIKYMQTAVGHSGTMYENGLPFHSNGQPTFDSEGYLLDRNGNRVAGVPPLERDEHGNLIFPDAVQTPSGGRSQSLADSVTGWFEDVEIKEDFE